MPHGSTVAKAGTLLADKPFAVAEKGTITADKPTALADKPIVVAEKGTITADKPQLDKPAASDKPAAEKGTITADKPAIAGEDFSPLGNIEGWSAFECSSGPFGHRG